MSITVLDHDDDAMQTVEQVLADLHGRTLKSFGIDAEGRSIVLGQWVGDELVAFGVFRDYRDPRLHVGSRIDLDAMGDILEMDEVGLYQIALLHSCRSPERLKEAAAALVRSFESWLVERYERYCLFITLMHKANRKALPLYKELGFKKVGHPSRLMRFDLSKLKRILRRIPPLPDDLEHRFFDEVPDDALRDFAECYQRVFIGAGVSDRLSNEDVLSVVTSGNQFSKDLSLLLLTRDEGRVVGFMLAGRPGPAQMNVDVAGLLPEVRGQKLPYRCLPPIAERALGLGIDHATFVTTQRRVARLTLRAFGAKELDRMQTYIKVG